MKRSITIRLALALAFCALAQMTNGATITWTSTPYTHPGTLKDVMGTGQFDQSGQLVYAENVGGSAVTFDGIDFLAHSGDACPNPASVFHVDSGTNPLSHPGAWSAAATTITLGSGAGQIGSDLIVGMSYRIQLYLMDGRNAAYAIGRYAKLDGQNMGVYASASSDPASYGDGLLVTGTFVADAATQAFTNEVFTSANASAGAQVNALLLYEDVPDLNDEVVIIGPGIRNGDFNDDSDLGDQRTFAQTPTWENMGNVDQSDSVTRLQADANPDETRHALVSGDSTRVLAQDTGHDIGVGNTFTVRYSWVPKTNWDLNDDEVRVTLFVTSDDTIDGTQTILATLDSGKTAVDRHVWQYAYGSVTINNVKYAGKRLFISIDPTSGALSTAFARIDNFNLVVNVRDSHLYELGEAGTINATGNKPKDSVGGSDFGAGANLTVASSSPSPVSTHYAVFNGVNAHYYNGNLSQFVTDDFAVELWARADNTTQDAMLFQTGNGDGRLQFALTGGSWSALYYNLGSIGDAVTAGAGTWTHLAVVRHAGSSTFYVNGIAYGTSSTATPVHTINAHLSVESGGGRFFDGDMDNIRLFEFARDEPNPVGMLTYNDGYFPFSLNALYGTDGEERFFTDPELTVPVTRGDAFASPIYFALSGVAVDRSAWNVVMRVDGVLGGGAGAGIRMTSKGFLVNGAGGSTVLDQLAFSIHSATEVTEFNGDLFLTGLSEVAANNFRAPTQSFSDGSENSHSGSGYGSADAIHKGLTVASPTIVGTGTVNFRLHGAKFEFRTVTATLFQFR
ncbi:MAG: LamG domain-containing protein [Verrucomicrobia bacterium]|nr:LamG domain-containing protein [Verrucomicrobiota bacterium]